MSVAVLEETHVHEAVFSICAPAEFVSSAITAIHGVSGATFAGEFQEYFTATRAPQIPPLLKNAQVCVALLDCDTDPEAALETMERLKSIMPLKCRVICVSAKEDASFLVRAIRAGCSEFLRKPLQPEELTAALRRFQVPTEIDGGTASQPGKAIAFVGAKGGVGTTTLAVHMAVHLVRTHKKRVLLVDQRHQLGHAALYLGIKQTKYHFNELLRNADRLDAPLLEGLITRHSPGLDVIASPDMCSSPYAASPDAAMSVINFLKQRYDYVLVDSESECTDWLPALIRSCDMVELVCNPDVAALRDAARQIEHLSLTDGFPAKVSIVVNRAGSEPAVSKDDIERALRFPVSVEVPNSYMELVKAINAGQPIVPGTKGRFTQSLAKWARTLADLTETSFRQTPAKKRFSLWG